MEMVMVTVRDVKMDMYSRPFFVHTEAAAIRSFSDEVNRSSEDNPYNKHPEDYALYCVGSFDDKTGRGEYFAVPKMLIQADQCVTGRFLRNKEEKFKISAV